MIHVGGTLARFDYGVCSVFTTLYSKQVKNSNHSLAMHNMTIQWKCTFRPGHACYTYLPPNGKFDWDWAVYNQPQDTAGGSILDHDIVDYQKETKPTRQRPVTN
ncbi:hypothetical protein ACA910_003270 [Epithemia clementina (nom. ined.)]